MDNFDEDNYIKKLTESQNSPLILEKNNHAHPKEKYIKGYMIDRFYTVEEYEKLLQEEMSDMASPYLIGEM